MTSQDTLTIEAIREWLGSVPSEVPLRKAALRQLNQFLGYEKVSEGVIAGYGERYLHLIRTFNGETPMTMTYDKFAADVEAGAKKAGAALAEASQTWANEYNAALKAALDAGLDFNILLAISMSKGVAEVPRPKTDAGALIESLEKSLGLKPKEETKGAEERVVVPINTKMGEPYKPASVSELPSIRRPPHPFEAPYGARGEAVNAVTDPNSIALAAAMASAGDYPAGRSPAACEPAPATTSDTSPSSSYDSSSSCDTSSSSPSE